MAWNGAIFKRIIYAIFTNFVDSSPYFKSRSSLSMIIVNTNFD